jgi:hypothetical protein
MRHRPQFLALTLALAAWLPSSRAALPGNLAEAVAWYDTLGFPDATDLPYVRVATGAWTKTRNQPPQNQFVEGFLVGEGPKDFTVFICSVSDFKNPFERFGPGSSPYPELTTVRFVRKSAGPAYSTVDYEALDFAKAASEVLDHVRTQASGPESDGRLLDGRPVSHRVRIFAFARACLQKGHADTGLALMNFAASIPDEQTGKVNPGTLRESLQQQIGDVVLTNAEADCSDPSKSWAELLPTYENFDKRFPASNRITYAREAAEVLRSMIAGDAAHHPKPMEQMSPAEQVAENIYQLENFKVGMWIAYSRYPDSPGAPKGGKTELTSVDRLVDLGQEAVPQLIAALDDSRFTRSLDERYIHEVPPRILRVSEIAQIILEHMSGRNFYAAKTDDGKLVRGTTREQVEAWWAENQKKGEKQVLIDATAPGGEPGLAPARKLVEKYPDAALKTIAAAVRATHEDGLRSEYIDAVGGLPGDATIAFLKSKLGPANGLYTQVAAAKALKVRGEPDAVPAMIEAWHAVLPRLPANESDAYGQVGALITFLAASGSTAAIDALREEMPKTPVDVRLAVVQVFLPFGNYSESGAGVSVNTDEADLPRIPGGKAGAAVESLLVSALDDKGRRVGMQGTYNDASYKDPRVCDMAALVLSKRWPDKYQFHWAANAADCDTQIAKLRDRWRSIH